MFPTPAPSSVPPVNPTLHTHSPPSVSSRTYRPVSVSHNLTRPSFPPVTRNRPSNCSAVTLESCAAMRCSVSYAAWGRGALCASGGTGIEVDMEEETPDVRSCGEEEDTEEGRESSCARGGGTSPDEAESEKVRTRPSAPPVTSSWCSRDSCTWQTRAVWPCRRARHVLARLDCQLNNIYSSK